MSSTDRVNAALARQTSDYARKEQDAAAAARAAENAAKAARVQEAAAKLRASRGH